MGELTQIGLHPVDPEADPLTCETCHKPITGAWYGSVEERDYLTALFTGYSYHCVPCTNVLARMADAMGVLAGADGNPIRLTEVIDRNAGGPE